MEDPELDQVIHNALSLQDDYPELYLPPNDKDTNVSFPRISLETGKPKSLNDPSRLQDTLVELYSILGIPQDLPVTRPFNLWRDQSTPSIIDHDEHQSTRQQAKGIKRVMPEEDTEISRLGEEEKEDQVPSTSAQKCRKRTLYNKQQTLFLQKQFDINPYPDYVSRCCFAQVTGIPEPRIQVWFQNRRARYPSKSSTSKEAEDPGVKPIIACEVSPNPKFCTNISAIHQIGPQAQRSKSSGHLS
ncbi:homeobox protein siamois-like [Hyla sarda]|uniref:homeobox protein siamois-like n=1 Tax=Hyla sarda TaxID=327740 RepID=UPI0024C29CCD|nr:homeobox protein siamois-like [Hyla sarda]